MKVIAKVNTQIADEKGELQKYNKGEKYDVTDKFFEKWKNHFKVVRSEEVKKSTKETVKS